MAQDRPGPWVRLATAAGAPVSVRIGIDLGGTKLSGVVLDVADEERVRRRVPSPKGGYAATIDAIVRLVGELEDAAGPAATVGVGTPGCWDARLGAMKNCNSTWLNDQALLPDLCERLGPRVRLANDADCLALSEASDGAGAGARLVFGVILGTGVGGGLVAGGRLLQGRNGLGGEWGHTPLPYFRQRIFAAGATPEDDGYQVESRLDDRGCYCGRLNCIETFLSGPGLAATHHELWGEEGSASDIARSGSVRAAETLALYRRMLARSLAQVVNLVDPDVMVLGGGVSNLTSLHRELEALIPRYAFSSVRGGRDVAVTVRAARWGDDSGVRGAARLWGEG